MVHYICSVKIGFPAVRLGGPSSCPHGTVQSLTLAHMNARQWGTTADGRWTWEEESDETLLEMAGVGRGLRCMVLPYSPPAAPGRRQSSEARIQIPNERMHSDQRRHTVNKWLCTSNSTGH